MSKRCVLGRCSNTPREGISVHKWPKDPKISKIWIQFVRRTREWTGPSKHSVLCSAHFGEEAYEEQTALAKEFGYKAKLREGAIPTILPKPATKRRKSVVDDDEQQQQQQQHSETEEMPSFSGVVTSTPVKPKERSAYHKRERARIIDDMFNLSQDSCSRSTSHACVVLENEDTCNLESMPCEDVEKQTRKVWTRGIQVEPKCVSTATQCELLKPRPLTEDESDDSDDDTMDDTTDDCDSDYEPMEDELDDSFHIEQSPSEPLHKQQILLVHESSLMKLFSYCPQCQSETPASIQRRRGSMVEIKQTCLACDFIRSWTSQPQIGDMPVGNFMLSAAMLFSGACIAKTLRVFKHLNIPSICYQTYFNHQALFLQPAVKTVWLNEQDAVLDDMKLAGFNAAGDGRADSPGHSAKFGTYTLLDTDMNKVVHIELVTVTQVANSNAMEKEGLIRALKFVDEKGMKVKELTTDRHSQIRKYLREKRPSIKHSLDVWHAAKRRATYF